MTAASEALPRKGASAPYMLQLDALRALAVAAVVFHHFTPGGWGLGATLGVKLFFSISGFLITGILLEARQRAEAENGTRIAALARFYARRSLRIFPLYYFVIGVAYAINLDPARGIIGWLLTYTLNIHMAQQGWYEAHFAHFWSLAVEEQFYLCWPWLILFLPRKWLLPAILAVVSVGPLYRWSYVLSQYENMTALSTYISTPTSLDHLGFGALLALGVRRFGAQMVSRFTCWLFPASVLASLILTIWIRGDTQMILFDATTAIALCCLVFWVSRGLSGPAGRFLEWRPFLYVGKIGYGLYLYHPFMPALAIWLLLQLGMRFEEHTVPVTVLGLALTFAITSVSWHLFEKPINDLKRHF